MSEIDRICLDIMFFGVGALGAALCVITWVVM